MKRSTKQLLSMLLAIVMVVGLMAPAMAATPIMGESAAVAETPVEDAPAAELSGSYRPAVNQATLAAGEDTGATTETPSAPSGTTYTFDPTKLPAAVAADKEDLTNTLLAGADVGGGFFSVTGTVDQRIKNAKTDPMDLAIANVEVAKGQGGSIDFTLMNKGTAVLTIGSTGGSNWSTAGLWDATNKKLIPVSELAGDAGTIGVFSSADKTDKTANTIVGVYGTSKKTILTYKDLPAGTYQVVSVLLSDAEGYDPNASKTVEHALYNLDGTPAKDSNAAELKPAGADNRAARIYGISVTEENGGGAAVTTKYSFDPTKLPAAVAADKEDLTNTLLAGADVGGGFFSVTGTVDQRIKNAKTDPMDLAIANVEVAKGQGGSIDFTLTGTGTAVLTIGSTGGSNWSTAGLWDKTNKKLIPVSELAGDAGTIGVFSSADKTDKTANTIVGVYGTSKKTILTYKDLPAGTYQVVSVLLSDAEGYDPNASKTVEHALYNLDGTPAKDSNAAELKPAGADNRAARIYAIDVEETTTGGTLVETDYTFDPTKLPAAVAADKEDLTNTLLAGADVGGGFFSVTGTVDQRIKNAKTDPMDLAIANVEVAKGQGGSIDFTLTGTGTAVLTIGSTGGSNWSTAGLWDKTNKKLIPVSELAGDAGTIGVFSSADKTDKTANTIVGVYGTSKKTILTYKDLPAGTYQVVSVLLSDAEGYDPNASKTVEHALYNLDGTPAKDSNAAELKPAGADNRAARIYGITVTEKTMSSGGRRTVVAKWTVDEIGAATSNAVQADGKINVSVEGPKTGSIKTQEGGDIVTTIYADSLKVVMFKDGVEMSTAAVENGVAALAPATTGKYTFKIFAVRTGEEDLLVGEITTPVDFTLPLAVPSINSAASNGLEAGKETASVTVSWSSVAEANSYNLYVKAHTATDWGEAISVPVTTAANVSYTVTGLTVGTEYDYAVEAIRNAGTIGGVAITAETTAKSATFSATATGTKQIAWSTKVFGPSASADYNRVWDGDYTADFTILDESGKPIPGTEHKEEIKGLTGDLNTDPEGRVLLSSREGAGKIQEPTGADGLLFHYTTVPAGYNYSLKAKVHVTRWYTRDTQNGLGLAAMDRVPAKSQTGSVSGNAGNYWNNSYMVGAARLGFTYDTDTGKAYYSDAKYGDPGADAYTKYSYYMGLCSITKHGTPDGYNGEGIADTFQTRRFPLDTRLCKDGVTAKYNGQNNRFNTIGNYTKVPAGWSAQTDETGKTMHKYEMTDFILELKKTPTGYVSTAWDVNGNLLGENIEYYSKGAAELSSDGDTNPYTHFSDEAGAKDQSGRAELGEKVELMDASAEYVGFFTSRDTDALFSDVEFDMWPQSEDDEPVQSPPVTTVRPTLSIASGTSSNTKDFTLSIATNVDGTVTISQNGSVIATDVAIEGGVRLDYPVELKVGSNNFKVSFKLDLDQVNDPDWPPYTVLDTVNLPKDATSTVTYKTYFQQLNNIYVAPYANSTGRGTRNSPVDVHTAVSVVAPGQNIILLPGEYKLTKTIRINRGMDGTQEKPIYFMADPERAEGEKVVLNGQGSAGTVLVHGSDWWIFKDFEVVGSSSGSTAFQLSGNHNIVQSVDAHDNGSTGFTVGRLSSSDIIPTRPTADAPASQVTDWGEWPCFNTFINCSAYRNYDSGYNGADGFGAKQTVGEGNVFDGCVAYWNADDGWDLFAKSQADMGPIGVVTLKNCITFENGYEVRKIIDPTTQKCEMEADGYTPKMNLDENGKIVLANAGNGNGFKMGGSHLPGAHVIENSYAFYNKAKGFDSNNGPDISVIGCTGYNNGDENVGLSSNSAVAYKVKKVVSFKDDKAYTGNEGKKGLKDGIKEGSNEIETATYYAWDGTKSSNGSKEITAANFASLDFDNTQWINGAVRKADGSLDLGDFLKLVDVTDAGAGELTNTETPVETPTIVPDPEPEVSGGGSSSGGNGGTASAPKPGEGDKPDDGDKPAPEKTYTADKKTNINGDTEIVVKDNNGEVVADVKIPDTIPAPETKFDDVPEDHWAEESINNMAALGIVNGTGNNNYSMNADVTRGAIATMLYRFAGEKGGKTNPFTDVAGGQWYTDAIAWAADCGVVTGYDATTFGPNDTITREQLAVMLYRFAKLIGMDGTVTDSALANYNDASNVHGWAEDGMAWCVEKGIINGVSADTLSPTTTATRAQTATMLDRFIALVK